MTIASRLLARLAHLPPPRTRDIAAELDLPVAMPDGAVLRADRYFPREDPGAPVVLMRTPYGRRGFAAFGHLFAERGYQAVIQSARGTFGSGGTFDAFRDEERDGRATLAWLAGQPWFASARKAAMFGPSYLGFAQWAVAANAPPFLEALAIQISASDRRASMYPGESFFLDFALTWMHTLATQEAPAWRVAWKTIRRAREVAPAADHLPLRDADRLATGRRVGYYQDWLEHNRAGDPFWAAIDYSGKVGAVTAHVNLVAGWYDYFLPRELADYAALRQAGRTPYLTIGPWAHTDLAVMATGLRESLAWFDARLRGDPSRLRRSPVRVFVLGAKRWIDLPDWPPSTSPTRWFLDAGGALSPSPARAGGDGASADCYDYDPADPTPSVGGALLGRGSGARDNRRLESRPDVLTFTSAPLEADLDVFGTVEVELHVRSSLEHTDFFARLCDVEPGGRSTNVCDGIVRLAPGRHPRAADGTVALRVALSPTACRFSRGHRVRLQVASGAHPRFSRNTGSGEPLGTATRLVAAHQEVFRDGAHPSAMVLPIRAEGRQP